MQILTSPLKLLLLFGTTQLALLLMMSVQAWLSPVLVAPARRFVSGIVFGIVAGLFALGRGHLPDLLTIVASSLLHLAAGRQVYGAVVELFGLAPLPRWERSLAFVGAAAQVAVWALVTFAGVTDVVRARPATIAVPLCVSAWCLLQRFLNETPKPRSLGTRYVIAATAMASINHLTRSVGPLLLPPGTDPFDTPLAVMAAGVMLTGSMLGLVGLLLEAERRSRAALEAHNEQLVIDASTDGLTGLANRRRLESAGAIEAARARRYGWPVAVLMLDVDNFKSINDRFGHAVGDAVLREVAKLAGADLRAQDVLARWGGEEFALMLPQCEQDAAARVAERIRRSLRELSMPVLDGARVTMSIGVAAIDKGDATLEAAVKRADEALYRAKHEGRDRVVVASSSVAG
jgi:diguanylate cyclase (GGDEF)-like protein